MEDSKSPPHIQSPGAPSYNSDIFPSRNPYRWYRYRRNAVYRGEKKGIALAEERDIEIGICSGNMGRLEICAGKKNVDRGREMEGEVEGKKDEDLREEG